MNSKAKDLCKYRISNASDTLQASLLCLENNKYKDSINRSYYAAFYAIKSVLALEETDFKRHKDVVAYFNKNYVAKGLFDREIGKLLGRLKRIREASDYDDFYVSSHEEALSQYEAAMMIIDNVNSFLHEKGIY